MIIISDDVFFYNWPIRRDDKLRRFKFGFVIRKHAISGPVLAVETRRRILAAPNPLLFLKWTWEWLTHTIVSFLKFPPLITLA